MFVYVCVYTHYTLASGRGRGQEGRREQSGLWEGREDGRVGERACQEGRGEEVRAWGECE